MKALKQSVRTGLALLVAGLLASQGCFGQADAWERVKLIQPDRKIHVKLLSGKTLKGNFTSWNADGLTMRQGKDKVTAVTKADVAQVAMLAGWSRKRKAGVAALVTGGVVGGLFAIGCAGGGGCPGEDHVYVIPGIAFYAGIAAGIAALFPQHKEVVYSRAPGAPPRK